MTTVALYSKSTTNPFSEFQKRLEGVPQKTLARSLFDVVVGKDAFSPIQDGIIFLSAVEKIRYFVQLLLADLHTEIGMKYATLAYAKLQDFQSGTFQVIKKLVRVIWLKPDGVEAKHAVYALSLLEKEDMTISLVNRQAKKYIAAKGQDRAKFLPYLRHFVQKAKPLILRRPVRPAKAPCPVIMPQGKVHPFWKIQTICIGNKDEESTDFAANLRDIAPRERFVIPEIEISNQELRWFCDPLILKEKKPLVPQALAFLDGVCSSVCKALYGNPQDLDLMGAVAVSRAAEQLHHHFPELVEQAPFYFEGGNLLEAINEYGQRVYLNGSANTLFTVLNLARTFSKPEIEEMIEETRHLPIEALRFAGWLEQNIFVGSDFFNDWLEEDQELLMRLFIVAAPRVLRKMEETLGCRVIQIGKTFEPQPEFHIDMFLVPAPGGKIFMHNHGKAIKLLDKLLEEEDLSLIDRGRLLEYREQACLAYKKSQYSLDAISDDLKAVGFDVIPVAGLFFDGDGNIAINYLNSVFGQNQSGVYCITNGSMHSADEHLQKAYVASLMPHRVARVYFTGRKSMGAISSFGGLPFVAAHESLKLSGGLRCRVQVMRGTHDYSKVYEMFGKIPELFNEADLPKQTSLASDFRIIVDEMFPTGRHYLQSQREELAITSPALFERDHKANQTSGVKESSRFSSHKDELYRTTRPADDAFGWLNEVGNNKELIDLSSTTIITEDNKKSSEVTSESL